MATHVIPKQLSIQDFVSELHKFPEKSFDSDQRDSRVS